LREGSFAEANFGLARLDPPENIRSEANLGTQELERGFERSSAVIMASDLSWLP